MTYREYRQRCDREYLTLMIARHKSVTAAASAAGIDRTMIYKIAARCGLALPSQPAANRGNEAWQRLAADSPTHI